MLNLVLLMPFLYFPEDKSEYIPAAFWFIVAILACVLFFRWIKRYSQKEQAKTRDLEERILRERQNKREQ